MKRFLVFCFIVTLMTGIASTTLATTIGGIEFPEGNVSFADAVYSYLPGTNVGPNYDDPNDALGIPNYISPNGSVSLGIGGSLILQFTDNSLTTSGDDTADLHIFEIGGVIEWMSIAISTDATNWISLGDIKGHPSSIDIDPFAGVVAGEKYSFVRINDIAPNESGYPYGEADIDAVGAISSAPPAVVPEPATILLLGVGLLGLAGATRRKLKK